jgi:hypothetical protein
MTTTALPNGIYLIEAPILNGTQGQYLTRENSGAVTILLSKGQRDPDQEVMCRFLTSSIVCCSPTILVASQQR